METKEKTSWARIIGLALLGAVAGGFLYIAIALWSGYFFGGMALLTGVITGALASYKAKLNPADTKTATILVGAIGVFGVLFGYLLPYALIGGSIVEYFQLMEFNFLDFMFIVFGGWGALGTFSKLVAWRYANTTKSTNLAKA